MLLLLWLYAPSSSTRSTNNTLSEHYGDLYKRSSASPSPLTVTTPSVPSSLISLFSHHSSISLSAFGESLLPVGQGCLEQAANRASNTVHSINPSDTKSAKRISTLHHDPPSSSATKPSPAAKCNYSDGRR